MQQEHLLNTSCRGEIDDYKNVLIRHSNNGFGFIQGLAYTMGIAIAAKGIAMLPFLTLWVSWLSLFY